MTTQKSLFLAVLCLVVFISGCDESLTDVNSNPNSPTDVDPNIILPYATESAVDLYQGAAVGMEFGNLIVQHWARIQGTDKDRYIYSNSSFSSFWEGGYSGPLMDFQRIQKLGEEQGNPNYQAVGMIMKAWYFSLLTDSFGDIPYSEALQGIDGGVTQPAFDRQEVIYTNLLQQLETASSMIVTNDHEISGDILYSGDMSKWQKFANSLRFRLLMRISGKENVSSKLASLVQNDNMFDSNEDNAQLVYLSNPPNRHPIIELPSGRRNQFRVSKTLVDRLKQLNDPRLEVYADTTQYTSATKPQDSLYVGVPNGLMPEDAAKLGMDRTSKIGSAFRKAETPGVIMTYAELNFLMAEAAEKGFISGSVESYYEKGIRASFDQHGVTGVDSYLSEAEVDFDPANALQQIGEQKWIALYGQGLEAWNDWKRTGFPDLEPSIANDNDDQIPVRMEYPFSAQITNQQNYDEAISRQGENSINTHVWWDE
ncbi:SusD/RagB family nutrient-binding outer membrane lipoprotein [Halalkalibaculum sp. DA384]|uniref:SusD/RagB family nutrient-binding outer membrane lipoprotein n=1 Tax=Halalkalibaculum sp. DA384 TaxID=3373606 RepID=UPI003754A065